MPSWGIMLSDLALNTAWVSFCAMKQLSRVPRFEVVKCFMVWPLFGRCGSRIVQGNTTTVTQWERLSFKSVFLSIKWSFILTRLFPEMEDFIAFRRVPSSESQPNHHLWLLSEVWWEPDIQTLSVLHFLACSAGSSVSPVYVGSFSKMPVESLETGL